MKRHGNLFEKIVSMDNLVLAHKNARKGKSRQKSIAEFDKNVSENLVTIQEILINKSFHTSPYKVKTIYEPKERLIYILPFNPDRIVQHALMNILEPIWEKLFIDDSYACRKGKGIHAGSNRTMEFLRKKQYCLKCDISKFYPSIDHDILFDIVQKKVKCRDTLLLVKDIIYSVSGGKNTPIGNYTSQWFGNLYMNELDQYLKHVHKIKHYIRYCDDFLLFHNNKAYLNDLKKIIKDFVWEKLKLKLSKCEMFPVRHGVDFLGYRHFRQYILLRKSTAKRVIKRLKALPGLFFAGQITRKQLISSLASTSGWLRWANTYNLSLKLQIDAMAGLYGL